MSDDLTHDSFPDVTDGNMDVGFEHGALDAAAQHHQEAKYSNTRPGNMQLRQTSNMHTIGAARAKFWQSDTKAP